MMTSKPLQLNIYLRYMQITSVYKIGCSLYLLRHLFNQTYQKKVVVNTTSFFRTLANSNFITPKYSCLC